MEELSPISTPPENISRSSFLIHTTSAEAAVAIAQEGKLRSPFSMLTDTDNPNAHLMQGGFRKFVAHGAREYTTNDLADKPFKPANIYKYVANPVERAAIETAITDEFYPQSVDNDFVWNVDGERLIKSLDLACKILVRRGYFGKDADPNIINQNYMWSWLHVFNTLPKEARTLIAQRENIEQYISTSLGYSLDKYAPEDKTRQAAILLPINSIAISDLQLIKNLTESIQLTDEELRNKQVAIDNLDTQAKQVMQEAHFGGGIPEISIMKNEVDLRAIGASIILPKVENATPIPLNLPVLRFDPHKQDLNNVIMPEVSSIER